MASHVPAGHVSVFDAYRQFRQVKWFAHDPLHELWSERGRSALGTDSSKVDSAMNLIGDLDSRQFLATLQRGDLSTLVRDRSGTNLVFEPSRWTHYLSPTLLVGGEIQSDATLWDDDWELFGGLTPFIDAEALDLWLGDFAKFQRETLSKRRTGSAKLDAKSPLFPLQLAVAVLRELSLRGLINADHSFALTRAWSTEKLDADQRSIGDWTWVDLTVPDDLQSPLPAPRRRRNRAMSPETRAILDYIEKECGGVWPAVSDGILAERIRDWIAPDQIRKGFYRTGPLSPRTVRRVRGAL